jgi:hypothetical protein
MLPSTGRSTGYWRSRRSCTVAPGALFTPAQEQFLAECGPLRVRLSELTALGPVDATRWDEAGAAGFDPFKPRAERWQVHGLDFLELSINVDPREADLQSSELDLLVRRTGLTPDRNQETKTRRVLQHLAG